MTRPEGDVFKSPAVLAERDLAFGSAVQIIENRLGHTPTRYGPEVLNTHNVGRRNCVGHSSHIQFQYP
jgi:hypothetical protein